MPTYEYACSKCGDHVEAVQSFNDDPLKKCPACGGRLKKVYGNVGIVFKGSGFYKTDSRNASKGSKATAATEKAGSEKSGSSDSGSSSDLSSKSATTGTDNGKKSATKDAGSSSKSESPTSAPAAAS